MSIFAPRQIRQLNINLLRSQAYPAAPWVTAQGVEQYQEQSQPVAYYPQAMAFGKWKTPPAGYGQGRMGQSAANVHMAREAAIAEQRRLHAAAVGAVPHAPVRAVAEPMNQLPPMQPQMNPQPWSTGVMERSSLQPSSNLMALAAGIARDPVGSAQSTYTMPRVGPPRMPDVYRVRPYAVRSGY